MQFDVVIIGGGIIGSATAYYLRKQGFRGRIAVIEKDPSYKYCCTALSCGGIRQQFTTPENIQLSLFGLKLLRRLKEEFGEDAEVGFKEYGYLVLASGAGRAMLGEFAALQNREGGDVLHLDQQALADKFPWLNVEDIAAGNWGRTGEGWLDPYSLLSLFRKATLAMDVTWIADQVTGMAKSPYALEQIELRSGEKISAGFVVNAAGTGGGNIAAMAGTALPVGPRKRYVFTFDCREPDQSLHLAPLTFDSSGLYFRPEGKQFICGLSPEEDEEPDASDFEIDYSWFEDKIWPLLAARVPAFEAIKLTGAWAGHYDYNELDQNGVIGRHPEIENFYIVNGFSGHGFQQGPGSGNAIAELIVHGEYQTIDLTRFGYERIQENAPLREVNVI